MFSAHCGTGTESVRFRTQAAAHVVEFLAKFYKIFPEFSSHDVSVLLLFAQSISATPLTPSPIPLVYRPTSPASPTLANTSPTSRKRSSKQPDSPPGSRAS